MATWSQRQITDQVIQSLTAGKITSGTLAVGTNITVGDPALPHLEIGGTSLRVFRPDSDGGLQTTIQLGGVDRDVIQITDPDTGATLAGLLDGGTVTAQSMTTQTLQVAGQKIGDPYDPDDVLWSFARGAAGYMMPYASIANSPTAGGTGMGAFEVSMAVQGGRQYRVDANLQLHLPDDGLPTSYVKLVHTLDGTAPGISSPMLQLASINWPAASGVTSQYTVTGYLTPGLDPELWYTLRVLVVFWRRRTASVDRGTIKVLSAASNPSFATIQDIGPVGAGFMADGSMSSGGGTPPSADVVVTPQPTTATRTHTSTYDATWSRTYYANDGYARSDVGDDLVQGYYSYGNVGMIGFPQRMLDDIYGSTISKIEVYLYAHHWYGQSGTAFVGVHGVSSQPSSWSSSGVHTSGNWSRGTGRWVTLPSTWYPAFETGTNKGITVGAGAGTNRANYGKFYGASDANNPKLRITYTK